MSIITPKMKQYRDELAASNSNCKVWFPYDEGTGLTITDAIGGIVETDATSSHNEPHSITFGKDSSAPTSGAYPTLKSNLLLVTCQKIVTSEAFITYKIGTDTFVNVSSVVASCDYGVGAGNGAVTASTSIGSLTGDIVTNACAVIGNSIYHYVSVNGAGITENATADASGFVAAFSAGDPTMDNVSLLGSTVTRQHFYGSALFTFDNGEFTTSEIIAALNEIDLNWSVGKKYLPESLL